MVTGSRISPQEAYDLGILNRLVPAERLAEETLAYAAALAEGAQQAIGSIKTAVYEGIERPLAQGLEREAELVEGLFRSADGQEGLRAFLEKRKPQFR
jgi:2-(1,2-epoxy-1,2-dihydrophenyl)acetyl-CoA isomerase